MTQKSKRKSGKRQKSPDHKPTRISLPPDPDRMNDQCAAWAKKAIKAYIKGSDEDIESVLVHLLTGLMHLCDRKPRLGNFDAAHARALDHYEEDTEADPE